MGLGGVRRLGFVFSPRYLSFGGETGLFWAKWENGFPNRKRARLYLQVLGIYIDVMAVTDNMADADCLIRN